VASVKRVTWAELFFDLVFVFAVTEVSALLHEDHSWAGAARALVVFVPVYWAWVGTSVHANTHDVENAVDRLGIFAVGLCSLFMSLAMPHAYAERGVLFGAAYWALRVFLAALVFRGPRLTLNPFSVALFVTGPLLFFGGFLPAGQRVYVWALAALVDLGGPALLRKRLTGMRFDPHHLPERFGLFLIIALGESIVAIGVPAASADHLTAGVVVAVGVAFVLACGLWWVYFVFAASAVQHALATARIQTDIIRQVLVYAHLALIGAIIAVAVGAAEVVHHPDHHLDWAVTGLLYGGTVMYLATFGYTRWRMFGTLSPTRLGAAALVLVLMPVAPLVPALVALAMLSAVLIALNVVEHVRVKRTSATSGAAYLATSAVDE
jgi:low temperature requirement protein LtrA